MFSMIFSEFMSFLLVEFSLLFASSVLFCLLAFFMLSKAWVAFWLLGLPFSVSLWPLALAGFCLGVIFGFFSSFSTLVGKPKVLVRAPIFSAFLVALLLSVLLAGFLAAVFVLAVLLLLAAAGFLTADLAAVLVAGFLTAVFVVFSLIFSPILIAPDHDAFLGVKAVFSLSKYLISVAFKHLFAHLISTIRWQAV